MKGLVTDRTQRNVFYRKELSTKGWARMTLAERAEWLGDPLSTEGANIFAYGCGILSALVFGTGMCLSMGVIGGGALWTAIGVLVGVIGMLGCGFNYPIYRKLLEKGKEKYAYEIIELARQIAEE